MTKGHECSAKPLRRTPTTRCKANKSMSRVQGKLTVERLRTDGGWPKLKAKAAATRHLVHFALELVAI